MIPRVVLRVIPKSLAMLVIFSPFARLAMTAVLIAWGLRDLRCRGAEIASDCACWLFCAVSLMVYAQMDYMALRRFRPSIPTDLLRTCDCYSAAHRAPSRGAFDVA